MRDNDYSPPGGYNPDMSKFPKTPRPTRAAGQPGVYGPGPTSVPRLPPPRKRPATGPGSGGGGFRPPIINWAPGTTGARKDKYRTDLYNNWIRDNPGLNPATGEPGWHPGGGSPGQGGRPGGPLGMADQIPSSGGGGYAGSNLIKMIPGYWKSRRKPINPQPFGAVTGQPAMRPVGSFGFGGSWNNPQQQPQQPMTGNLGGDVIVDRDPRHPQFQQPNSAGEMRYSLGYNPNKSSRQPMLRQGLPMMNPEVNSWRT